MGLACTDLLNSRAILKESRRTVELAATNGLDQPCGMQLYGNASDPLPEAACWAIDHGAALIDINMGCPVDKVAKKNGGSLLLCDVPSTLRLAEAIVRRVERHSAGRVPVTAKMRLGWDPDHFVAPELARRLEDIGIQAVTVHGRFTVQFFSGVANWDAIGEVVAAVRSIPVIGNGDVDSPLAALELRRRSGCQGVMIGRAALREPWLFRRALAALKGGVDSKPPTLNEKLACILRHVDLLRRYADPVPGLRCMQQRISWYGKTLGHAKPLKEAIRLAPTLDAVERALRECVVPAFDHLDEVPACFRFPPALLRMSGREPVTIRA